MTFVWCSFSGRVSYSFCKHERFADICWCWQFGSRKSSSKMANQMQLPELLVATASVLIQWSSEKSLGAQEVGASSAGWFWFRENDFAVERKFVSFGGWIVWTSSPRDESSRKTERIWNPVFLTWMCIPCFSLIGWWHGWQAELFVLWSTTTPSVVFLSLMPTLSATTSIQRQQYFENQ